MREAAVSTFLFSGEEFKKKVLMSRFTMPHPGSGGRTKLKKRKMFKVNILNMKFKVHVSSSIKPIFLITHKKASCGLERAPLKAHNPTKRSRALWVLLGPCGS